MRQHQDGSHIRRYASTLIDNIVSSSGSHRKRNTRSCWLLFLCPK
nr:MAG TPA: hypothetical protein [Caudoviricetes sp.]